MMPRRPARPELSDFHKEALGSIALSVKHQDQKNQEDLLRLALLQSFQIADKTMDVCCTYLKVEVNSTAHLDLVRAIVQLTGYGKKHVTPDGLVQPRAGGLPGFTPRFRQVVEDFLVKHKGSIIFFPTILPGYTGWNSSFLDERLQWNKEEDRDAIREGLLHLIELIKKEGPINIGHHISTGMVSYLSAQLTSHCFLSYALGSLIFILTNCAAIWQFHWRKLRGLRF